MKGYWMQRFNLLLGCSITEYHISPSIPWQRQIIDQTAWQGIKKWAGLPARVSKICNGNLSYSIDWVSKISEFLMTELVKLQNR